MIYLDHNATTPLHPSVLDTMVKLAGNPLNPSAIHSFGRIGKNIIETARRQIAKLIGVEKEMRNYRITFTASGTEANNLIISNYKEGDIFISAIEHVSIAVYQKYLPHIKVIKVDRNGVLDIEDLEKHLLNSNNPKKLVSIMLANNETGVIQPLKEICKLVHKYGAAIHSDCVQAPGKIPLNLIDLNIDFATISAHKFGGPLGAAALVAKEKYTIEPLIVGGGQEKNRRSGTENVAAIAGFGIAAEIAYNDQAENFIKTETLRNKTEQALLLNIPELLIVSKEASRLPNTSLLLNPGKAAGTRLIALDLKGIAVSSGAACSSGKVAASNVLKAMGYDDNQARSAIRMSVGPNTKISEIDQFITTYLEINKR